MTNTLPPPTQLFTTDAIALCDKKALKYLFLKPRELSQRRLVPELQSVLYRETGPLGGALYICLDGSLLFTSKLVGAKLHRQAFEQGLRTDPKVLEERRWSLEEELFS